MGFWVLIQVFINFVLLAAVGFLWFRLQRPAKDDPRLSRGLQLLQSKIAVLEDLSDRTEHQVSQITALLDQKVREIQTHLLTADKHVQKIESSMGKSLEVAKIFQDKIPHQEIIERQNTIKYVKAARLANQGLSLEEIAEQVDLTRGELEFISKVNRENLQFSEADLPAWAHDGESQMPQELVENPMMERIQHTAQAKQVVQQTTDALSNLGNQFRQAFDGPLAVVGNQVPMTPPSVAPRLTAIQAANQTVQRPTKTPNGPVTPYFARPEPTSASGSVVKKVIFPTVDPTNF